MVVKLLKIFKKRKSFGNSEKKITPYLSGKNNQRTVDIFSWKLDGKTVFKGWKKKIARIYNLISSKNAF